MTYHYIRKHIPLRSLSVQLSDVKRIFERLTAQLSEEADRQISALQQPPDLSEEEFRDRIANFRRNAFRITVTIGGADGQDLHSDAVEVFSSPNLPDTISYIFMTDTVAYQGATGQVPLNRFSFNLDFGKRPLIDNPVSDPTPNNSNLTIEGDRDAWVATIQEAVMGVLRNRKTGRTILHCTNVYDVGLLILGLPFAMYLCWKASPLIAAHVVPVSSFLAIVTYIYIGVLGIWLFRILFGYTKWAFPSVELQENSHGSKSHRGFWSVIIVGLLINFLTDIFHILSQ